ncbi:hypothetical protein J2Y41_004573 [Arthrobacter sp. 1088]|nr:hypothetical protein [Arthrobacter sp. 1088]
MATHGPVKQKAPALDLGRYLPPSGIKDITAGVPGPEAPFSRGGNGLPQAGAAGPPRR